MPKDMDFPGVNELEIIQEGNSIILRPVLPDWSSFAECVKADGGFMEEKEDVVGDDGRFEL